MMKRMIYQKLVSCFVTGIILIGMVVFLLLPKKTFSEQENQELERFPKFSKEAVLDGSFIEGLEIGRASCRERV